MTEPTPPRRPARRRRRSKAGSPADAPPAPVRKTGDAESHRTGESPPGGTGEAPIPGRAAPARRPDRSRRGESAAERALHSLISSRPTQISPTAAMRAREVAAPSADDLAAAEREVVIIRRNYVPPAPLGAGRRSGKGSGRRSRAARTDQTGQDGRRADSKPGDGTHRPGGPGQDGRSGATGSAS